MTIEVNPTNCKTCKKLKTCQWAGMHNAIEMICNDYEIIIKYKKVEEK